MKKVSSSIELFDEDFVLCAQLVPWDSDAFGFTVAHINRLGFSRHGQLQMLYQQFEEWRDACNVHLVSCRLPHNCLNESIILEKKGFRFIEMILHPFLDGLNNFSLPNDTLSISEATGKDISSIKNIAENAFSNERYSIDPRLDSTYGAVRYGNWVENSYEDQKQQLLKIEDCGRLIGFFIIEIIEETKAYWHLTAIAPALHRQGYGKRVWQAMLKRHVEEGLDSVSTAISARNTPVLNLYSQLSFHFLPPEMTFHWIRS